MQTSINYIQLLYNQDKYKQAIEECKKLLSEDPEDVVVIYYLAISLIEIKLYKDAELALNQGMAIDPEYPWFYYAKATLYYYQSKSEKALASILEGLKIDPENDDFYALQAHIHLENRDYYKALDSTTQALNINPENTNALNNRAKALARIGKKDDAKQVFEKSLELDPNNESTFASLGYRALEEGKSAEALEVFREALRLNANNVYAQNGLKEALKAKYWFYRKYLAFELFLEENNRNLFYITVGINFLLRAVKIFSPMIAVLLFVALLFIRLIKPLSNVYLYFHPFGKMILDDKETKTAQIVGIGFVFSMLIFIAYLTLDEKIFANIALNSFLLLIPLSVSLSTEFVNKNWNIVAWSTTALSTVLVFASAFQAYEQNIIFDSFGIGLIVIITIFCWIF